MASKLNPLIANLYSGIINKEEFVEQYFGGVIPNEDYVLALLDKGLKDKDPILVEEAIVLINTGVFLNFHFVQKLCALLLLGWHKGHEDIAMILKEIADPDSVECLYKATELQFDYLDYDETCQFARKCIKAIAGISGEDSINKLKLLSKSSNMKISEYAFKELRYKRNGSGE